MKERTHDLHVESAVPQGVGTFTRRRRRRLRQQPFAIEVTQHIPLTPDLFSPDSIRSISLLIRERGTLSARKPHARLLMAIEAFRREVGFGNNSGAFFARSLYTDGSPAYISISAHVLDVA